MSASSIQQLDDAIFTINSKSGNFNTDPKTGSIDYVKNWLIGSSKYYSKIPCIINIDSVLNPATSTKATTVTVTP